MEACNSNENYLAAETSMAQTRKVTDGITYSNPNVDYCGHRLPCGLCRLITAPRPMWPVVHNKVTCSNTGVK